MTRLEDRDSADAADDDARTVHPAQPYALFFRYDVATRRFVREGTWGLDQGPGPKSQPELTFRLAEERGLVGLVGARARSHYVVDTQSEPRWSGFPSHFRSAYLTPALTAAGDVIGVLVFLATRSDGFPPSIVRSRICARTTSGP